MANGGFAVANPGAPIQNALSQILDKRRLERKAQLDRVISSRRQEAQEQQDFAEVLRSIAGNESARVALGSDKNMADQLRSATNSLDAQRVGLDASIKGERIRREAEIGIAGSGRRFLSQLDAVETLGDFTQASKLSAMSDFARTEDFPSAFAQLERRPPAEETDAFTRSLKLTRSIEDRLENTTDPRERGRLLREFNLTMQRSVSLATEQGQLLSIQLDPDTGAFTVLQGPSADVQANERNSQVNSLRDRIDNGAQVTALFDDMIRLIEEDPTRAGPLGTIKGITTKFFGAAADIEMLLGEQGDTFIDRGLAVFQQDFLTGKVEPELAARFIDTEMTRLELFSQVAAFMIGRSLKIGRGTERNMKRFEKLTSFKGIKSSEQAVQKLRDLSDIINKQNKTLSGRLRRLEIEGSKKEQFVPSSAPGNVRWFIRNGKLVEK